MTRGSAVALTALGGYGVALAVTGVAFAVGSSGVTRAPVTERTLTAAPTRLPSAGALLPGPSVSPSAVPPARLATVGADQVTSFRPGQIVLPNGATAPVTAVDVAPDGALIIPVDPQVVGYWTGGALPGERFGSVVIAGHVDSARFGIGVLAGLKGVRAGAVIQVRGGGARLSYRVTQTRTVLQQSLATDDEYFRQDGPPRLVVITCGGPFDPVRHRYQDNYIVLASPLG